MLKLKRIAAGFIAAASLTMCSGAAASVFAANPVVQTVYTADGAPMVWNDTFYLYTGHDEDNANYFTMNDWRCYSSTDMQNWTDLGVPLDYKAFSWASGEAWAAQVVERGGKFYYYVTVTAQFGGRAIGVAVADHPEGPFVDPIGKPLCGPDWSYIDPTVYVDDDGQAYLYWGNPKLWMVKLNEDMISYEGEPVEVDPGYEHYTEAPYLYKHGGKYYMVYAADGVPENIAYSMSDSPTGPWVYCGNIMTIGGNSFTNHPGIIDYKGYSYFTYHTGTLPGGSGFDRSMCIEEMYYDADGRIIEMTRTDDGPAQLEALNPYQRNEAETICWEEGVETEDCSAGGRNVCDMQNGEYIRVSGIDFGAGAEAFKVSASSALSGGTLELHLDSRTGTKIGTVQISGTGGWQNWKSFNCEISGAEGVHDLYFTFSGEGSAPLFNMDWWQFSSSAAGSAYRKGDLNNDGIISAADLALAKRGMRNGFADPAAESAADLDENGKVDQNDIRWYPEYLTGQTKSFPKSESPAPAIDLSKYTAEFASVDRLRSYKKDDEHNPLITQYFGADPGVMEYDGRIYIFMTDDHLQYDGGNVTDNNYGAIDCLRLISSDDLVNWTDHGLIQVARQNGAAKWAWCAWAPTACHKKIGGKEKFFLYFANNANGIGVLTSDSPTGPWSDPIGHALIDRETVNCTDIPWVFDPAVLVDDDGTGYLYFGGGVPEGQNANPKSARVVRLGDDMVSLADVPQLIDAPYIFEDSGISKIGDKYYYSYCSNWSTGGNPYGLNAAAIEYMVSDSPTGPFTYAGEVFQNIGTFFGTVGNNHHTIMPFKGRYYLFYHAQYLQDQMGLKGGYRSTHIDEVSFENGKFGSVTGTTAGVSQVKPLDPFETVQAETFSHQGGVTIDGAGNTVVCGKRGSWFGVTGAACGNAKSITLRASSASGAMIGIFTGSASGKMVGCIEIPAGGTMQEITAAVSGLSGTQNLYFVFSGDAQIDTWMLQ